ncbi:MAG: hypothetical protein R2838_10895 [Caldilineaceae bacterium]
MGMTLAALHDDAAACEEFMHAQRLDSDDESLLLTTALAQAQAGQTPEMTGLSAVEQQYVHAVRALHDDDATPDDVEALVARQPDETVRTLWRTLLNMKSTPNASPLVGLSEAASAVDADLAVPIIDYYVGVAALRRRDHEAATAAWERARKEGWQRPPSPTIRRTCCANRLKNWLRRRIGKRSSLGWKSGPTCWTIPH